MLFRSINHFKIIWWVNKFVCPTSFWCHLESRHNYSFIVKSKSNEHLIDWGEINQPLSEKAFDKMEKLVKNEMNGKELFVFDGFAGADKRYQLSLRVVTLKAYRQINWL